MYQVLFTQGTYQIVKQGLPVHTPAGGKVVADSEMLAQRLKSHFTSYGASSEDWRSITHFHFPMLDFVSNYSKQDIIQRLGPELNHGNDWTLKQTPDDPTRERRRASLFGNPTEQISKTVTWLETLNHYQLCAAMVLGRDIQSYNAACLIAECASPREEKHFVTALTAFKPELGGLPLRELLSNHRFYRSL